MKDASDLLQAGRPGDIEAVIYSAAQWRPAGIRNAKDCLSAVLADREVAQAFRYPEFMPELQRMSGGIRRGETTYHVAGTGVGKSTGLREIVHDLRMVQGVKCGVLSFEDTSADCMLLYMSLVAGERLVTRSLPPIDDPEFTKEADAWDKKVTKLHAVTFDNGLLELFDAETAEWTIEAIISYVRYMARALGCDFIVIDPLSFIAALMAQEADERRALDLVAATLAKLAKELHVAIAVVHHLKRTTNGPPHEEGYPTSLNELRSSGGLANFATFVVGWERNNQAAGEGFRVTRSRVLKQHRSVGLSGLADTLYYNEQGRLVPSPIDFPPVGKPDDDNTDSGARGGKSSFHSVDPRDYD